MYRIQNEERWIEHSLRSASYVCDEIVILDDCSTDRTVEICKKFPKVVEIYERKEPLPLDEVRDRNILLKIALKQNPNYIFTLDGDEILAPCSKEFLLEELNILYPNINVLHFQILTVWDNPNMIRTDGHFGISWHPRLIKIDTNSPLLEFQTTSYEGNLHCYSSIVHTIKDSYSFRSDVKILHYGYYDENTRQRKFRYYNKIDPNNVEQDGYIHIISGKGKHSGPHGIKLKKLPPILYYEGL